MLKQQQQSYHKTVEEKWPKYSRSCTKEEGSERYEVDRVDDKWLSFCFYTDCDAI